MVTLRLLKDDYHPVVDGSEPEEPMLIGSSETELPEQEYLDFADEKMKEVGDDPQKLAEHYNIHIYMLTGSTLRESTREETRNRLAAVFKLRDTEPWEEAGFGD